MRNRKLPHEERKNEEDVKCRRIRETCKRDKVTSRTVEETKKKEVKSRKALETWYPRPVATRFVHVDARRQHHHALVACT